MGDPYQTSIRRFGRSIPRQAFNEYDGFCTWSYAAPVEKPRGFWHGDDFTTKPLWAYALRSDCGTFWKTSEPVSGFVTEEFAIAAAREHVTREQAAHARNA